MANDTIGIHYELPDGRIAYTFGFNGPKKEISYRFDGDPKNRTVSEAKFQTWTPRPDLEDFPNASDPRLPYTFDLFWDIKYMSQLRQELVGHEDEQEIRLKMVEHGISI